MAETIFTIGRWTRGTAEFLAPLHAHGVEHIADVRTIPRSRDNPQYYGDRLSRSLKHVGIRYVHLKMLRGRRRAGPGSVNLGWHNASFRGFAHHMETETFAAGLPRLELLAARRPTAVTCAEAFPWRCHRSLIADALTLGKMARPPYPEPEGRASPGSPA